jgi:hypothetical protein
MTNAKNFKGNGCIMIWALILAFLLGAEKIHKNLCPFSGFCKKKKRKERYLTNGACR